MKISMLQGLEVTKAIFTKNDIEKLKKIGEVVINEIEGSPSIDNLKSLIKNADIVITSWGCTNLDNQLLDLAPNLKMVIHAAGSIKPIISDEFIKRDIRIANNANVLGKGVAETALGFTIMSIKNIFNLSNQTKKGKWVRTPIREMYDINIGVIGAGWVGKHYIKLLKNFDVNIYLYDPTLTVNDAKALGAKKVELEELLKICDVISLHAPSIEQTNNMINKDNLKLLKENAILINTARGTLINEDDLIVTLKKKNIFACIDVTNPEPPIKRHKFRQLSNVILTPHIAGLAGNGKFRIGNNTIKIIG